MDNLLIIRNLKTYFFTYRGVVKALDGINLDLKHEETLGLVGETGCGKSVSVRSILRLIPPPGEIVEGQIIFDGVDLLRLSERQIRNIRGNRISMVMQEPSMSLNSTFRAGYQIAEALMAHGGILMAKQKLVEGKPNRLRGICVDLRGAKEDVDKFKDVAFLETPEFLIERDRKGFLLTTEREVRAQVRVRHANSD